MTEPCKAIAPVVETQDDKFPNIKFVEIDVDESRPIAQKYQITGMPSFVFIHNKKEVSRTVGANVPAILKGLQELSGLNPSAVTSNASSSGSGSGSSGSTALPKEVKDKIPKGFEVLNDTVHFGEAELLNASHGSQDAIRGLLDLSKKNAAIKSDADSQLMLYLPLQNKTKLHTIFVQSRKGALADDENADELQEVAQVKVWANTIGLITFEDATDGVKALHNEDVSDKDLGDGWRELKLRYVHFQNVASVLIFFDGEDEDNYTVLEKIVLVGSKGENRDQGKLEKAEDE